MIKKIGGIKLDVGAGDNIQEGFIGMDMRKTKNADIVHNAEVTPYPLPDEICHIIICSHLVEHLNPAKMIDIMNEWWRLLKETGQLWLSMPYAGSFGFWQDPTHIKTWNEATATYFDPSQFLYNIYKPKPYKIIRNVWHEGGNLEVVFEKLPENHGVETPKGYDHIQENKKKKKGKAHSRRHGSSTTEMRGASLV
jgi:predicted SAM-dependent methyltransferase